MLPHSVPGAGGVHVYLLLVRPLVQLFVAGSSQLYWGPSLAMLYATRGPLFQSFSSFLARRRLLTKKDKPTRSSDYPIPR